MKGRRKSLNLPAGVVGFRAIGPNLLIDDEEPVLRWAKEHCASAVVVVERLSRSALKSHFVATGELPEAGAHVEPSAEKFYIRDGKSASNEAQPEEMAELNFPH